MPESTLSPQSGTLDLASGTVFVRLRIDGDWQGGAGEHHLHAGQGDEEREAPGGRQAEDGGRRIFEVKRQSHKISCLVLANKTLL
jgi:hypothetical protein